MGKAEAAYKPSEKEEYMNKEAIDKKIKENKKPTIN